MQGKENGSESIRQGVQSLSRQDVFARQEGVAASLQTWLAGLHLLFKASTAPVLCDHRNSKLIQAQKFLIAFLEKPCLTLPANVIYTTEMTSPTGLRR